MKHCTVLLVCLLAGLAHAVTPAEWKHTTEADFASGKFDSTVAGSLGELTLARKIKVLMSSQSAPPVVSAVAAAGKTLYAASGSSGAIYKIVGKKASKFATTPGTIVNSLLVRGKELLAGVGGDKAGIYRIDKAGKAKLLWSDPAVRYVWAIASAGKGGLYAATGPKGKVFAVGPAGKGRVIYEAGKLAKNIRCLAVGPDGCVYVGTDKEGLVVKIDPAAGTGRVLLDAGEKEISVVLPDGVGGLYAATCDASKASKKGAAAKSSAKAGKADRTEVKTRKAKPKGKPKPKPKPKKASLAGWPVASSPMEMIKRMVASRKAAKKPDAPSGPVAKGKGNAVYHIGAGGLVSTILRRPVVILGMVLHQGRLILATGDEGAIYSLTTDGDEVARIADTDAGQVTAVAVAADGRIVFATANKGSVGALGSAFAKEGTFTSKVLDAKQIAKWGTVKVDVSLPAGAKAAWAARSGNVSDPDEKTWSDWSQVPLTGVGFQPIASPPGRFLQYRLKLTSEGEAAPVVRRVAIIYQVGNLAPKISGVIVKASGSAEPRSGAAGKGPAVFRHVAIKAADPNKDKLKFTLAFRECGTAEWIEITDKLDKPAYVWDTRTVGDGIYQLRVTASDSPSNPPAAAATSARISEPVVVDNTCPVLRELIAGPKADAVAVSGLAVDAGTRIVAIHYAVDSQKDWTSVLPSDGIADSPREEFAFQVERLAAGPHRITVRVRDLYGNLGYAAVTVTLGK